MLSVDKILIGGEEILCSWGRVVSRPLIYAGQRLNLCLCVKPDDDTCVSVPLCMMTSAAVK